MALTPEEGVMVMLIGIIIVAGIWLTVLTYLVFSTKKQLKRAQERLKVDRDYVVLSAKKEMKVAKEEMTGKKDEAEDLADLELETEEQVEGEDKPE